MRPSRQRYGPPPWTAHYVSSHKDTCITPHNHTSVPVMPLQDPFNSVEAHSGDDLSKITMLALLGGCLVCLYFGDRRRAPFSPTNQTAMANTGSEWRSAVKKRPAWKKPKRPAALIETQSTRTSSKDENGMAPPIEENMDIDRRLARGMSEDFSLPAARIEHVGSGTHGTSILDTEFSPGGGQEGWAWNAVRDSSEKGTACRVFEYVGEKG